jgi:hypothetical protein
MHGENGIPETPDWMAQARPAIERLEARALPEREVKLWEGDQA